MTTAEFNAWLRRHQSLFPKLAEWFASLPDARAVLDAWSKALASCDAKHASDATDRMLRGVPPLVEFNDWATLPSVVIQHCRPLGSGKSERQGDGNYISGKGLSALRTVFAEKPPEKDAECFAEFQEAIAASVAGDLDDMRQRVLGRMDDSALSGRSAYRLLLLINERRAGCAAGNVGDAWEPK